MSKLLFVGCGKTKRDFSCTAAEMYCGSICRQRIAYAQASGHQYLILSAKHGLLSPDTIISPYELAMSDLSPLNQIAWAVGVARQLCELIDNDASTFPELRKIACEIHAGAEYAERLMHLLIAAGFSASWPVCGLSQGSQMKWYADRLRLPSSAA